MERVVYACASEEQICSEGAIQAVDMEEDADGRYGRWLYVALVGWWICLVYYLVGLIMMATIVGM